LLKTNGWLLSGNESHNLLTKLQEIGTPLGESKFKNVHWGIKTGANDVYVIDEHFRDLLVTRDPASDDLIKPWLRGRDINRWEREWAGTYIIVLQNSGDATANNPWNSATTETEAAYIFESSYPAIFEYMKQHESILRRRQDQGRFWWELRPCAYWSEFNEPKIMWAKYGIWPAFTHDTEGYLCGNTAFILPTQEIALVGILNSSTTNWFAKTTFNVVRGGYIEWISGNLERIPLPNTSSQVLHDIGYVVHELLQDHSNPLRVNELENELNRLVYQAYDLTPAEIELIERETYKGKEGNGI